MAESHNPGPWIYTFTGDDDEWPDDNAIWSVDENGEPLDCIFELSGSYRIENIAADARLMALAPELYEYVASSASNGCATAAALIAKAEGDIMPIDAISL